jgi:hypothetical protein
MSEKKLHKIVGKPLGTANPGFMTHKMVQPKCSTCRPQDQFDDWHKRCQHNPWYGRKRTTDTEESIVPNEAGKLVVVPGESTTYEELVPNFVEVTMSPRVGSGVMPQFELLVEGFKEVWDVEPGFARVCDTDGCWKQDGIDGVELQKVRLTDGEGFVVDAWFCSDYERKLARADVYGRPVEQVLGRKRAEQLERY